MRRREPSSNGLPAGLRTYHPDRWLVPDEDPTDPVAVHYFAWLRWLTACADTLGVPLGELPAEYWNAAGTNRGRCTCWRCAPRRENCW